MRNLFAGRASRFIAFLLLSTFLLLPALAGKAKAPASLPGQLKVGSMAPDFTLKQFNGKDLTDVSLHDFKGRKNVVVAFFVFAFTGG